MTMSPPLAPPLARNSRSFAVIAVPQTARLIGSQTELRKLARDPPVTSICEPVGPPINLGSTSATSVKDASGRGVAYETTVKSPDSNIPIRRRWLTRFIAVLRREGCTKPTTREPHNSIRLTEPNSRPPRSFGADDRHPVGCASSARDSPTVGASLEGVITQMG